MHGLPRLSVDLSVVHIPAEAELGKRHEPGDRQFPVLIPAASGKDKNCREQNQN